MNKYTLFDENSNGDITNVSGKEKIVLNTLNDLKKLLATLDVHAEAEVRYQNLCTVKHMKNIGGAQYIANAQQNFNLLQKLAEKIDNSAAYATYYIRLTGQEIEV